MVLNNHIRAVILAMSRSCCWQGHIDCDSSHDEDLKNISKRYLRWSKEDLAMSKVRYQHVAGRYAKKYMVIHKELTELKKVLEQVNNSLTYVEVQDLDDASIMNLQVAQQAIKNAMKAT